MFIKGDCAIYIDKNLKVYENSTVLFVLCPGWNKRTPSISLNFAGYCTIIAHVQMYIPARR